MPNTHRRRDTAVELSRVGVGGVNTIRNDATSSRRMPSYSVDNLETDQKDSLAVRLREL